MAAPVASIGDVMKVLFACQAKNLAWSGPEKRRDLRDTVLQRQTCRTVNDMALGIARPPLPLNYTGNPSEQTFTIPEPPKVFHRERRRSIHGGDEEPLAKRV